MKKIKTSIVILVLFFVAQITKAQNDTKNSAIKDFDKVQIENINGEIEIQLGNQYAISVSGNNNAQKQVRLTKIEDKLVVILDAKFVTNWKDRKPVKIKIIMPEISKLYNSSNADVSVINFVGKYLGIENNGNGNVSLIGSFVDFIEIKNNGNGNLETKNINSKKMDIFKTGNGDVSIKTDADFNVEMNGNGDIVNYGKGKAIIKKQSGSGKIVYRN